MAAPACLTLAQVFQLIRYELGFNQKQIAERARLSVETYDALERGVGQLSANEMDRLMERVPLLLPILLDLPPSGPLAGMMRKVQTRIHDLELASLSDRVTELNRVRLELNWRDGKL